VTRKAVHVGTGVLIFFAPPFFPRAEAVILIAALFVAVNTAAYARGWLTAVHHTNRQSFGTVYYPLALLLLAAAFWDRYPDLVVAAVMVMAIGDAAAGIVGQTVKKPLLYRVVSDAKSVQGSMAMFTASFAALLVTLLVYDDGGLAFGAARTQYPATAILALVAASLFATASEAVSSRGLDNLTVPVLTAIALHVCFASGSEHAAFRFAAGAGLGIAVAVAAYTARMLQASGALAAFLLAAVIFGIGGWAWTIPIFTFFLLSSLLSKWRQTQKVSFESMFEKSGNRDAGQVAANGSLIGALALLWHATGDDRLYLLSLVAAAVVTADTWGTEIGVLARRQPRSILTGKPVAPGTSGGISLSGTMGGFAGATVVTLTALPFVALTFWQFILIVLSGACGSIIDSILGAAVQAQFRCQRCGKETEKPMHCGVPSEKTRGIPWLRNDAVNLVSTACAIALSALILMR
jgi:uncharacterized protein (TIGR00297 family)